MAVTFAGPGVFFAATTMNTRTAMKAIRYLAYFATLGVFALLLSITFDVAALPVFGLAASSLLLLVGLADYSPRAYAGAATAARRVEAMPLAA